jgi:hypothetical protein
MQINNIVWTISLNIYEQNMKISKLETLVWAQASNRGENGGERGEPPVPDIVSGSTVVEMLLYDISR